MNIDVSSFLEGVEWAMIALKERIEQEGKNDAALHGLVYSSTIMITYARLLELIKELESFAKTLKVNDI